jgi:hypothetical protein
MSRAAARWLLAAWVVLAACSDGPGEVPISCPGDRPEVVDCFSGRNFADCGGTGAPLFGCSDTDCRWFVAGCVAAGYVASSCPADDLCCHDNAPFAPGELGDDWPYELAWALYGNGIRPWNRTDDMVVTVSIDPALAVGSTELSCAGGLDVGDNPCDQEIASASAGDRLEIQLGEVGLWGSLVIIEVDTAAGSGPVARACEFPYTDDVRFQCPRRDSVDCAVSGTLTLSSLDGTRSIAGTVDLVFASDARLSGTFATD